MITFWCRAALWCRAAFCFGYPILIWSPVPAIFRNLATSDSGKFTCHLCYMLFYIPTCVLPKPARLLFHIPALYLPTPSSSSLQSPAPSLSLARNGSLASPGGPPHAPGGGPGGQRGLLRTSSLNTKKSAPNRVCCNALLAAYARANPTQVRVGGVPRHAMCVILCLFVCQAHNLQWGLSCQCGSTNSAYKIDLRAAASCPCVIVPRVDVTHDPPASTRSSA